MSRAVHAAAASYGARSRRRRADRLLELLQPRPTDRILDLGGADGTHFAQNFPELRNVVVADVIPERLELAHRRYGYGTVLLADAAVELPFDDDEFDIVFCSSVIEHATGPKSWARRCQSRREFNAFAASRQATFAAEIARIGRGYWVQTPYKYFPIETHSWLPLPVIWLPRRSHALLNRFWLKRPLWDFRLLTASEMQEFFPGGQIWRERSLGFVKSLVAWRAPDDGPGRNGGGRPLSRSARTDSHPEKDATA